MEVRHLVCVFCSVMSDSLWPHGLQPTKLLCTWDFSGKNTGVGCNFLLQGIFLTQGSNLRLLCLLYVDRFSTSWAICFRNIGRWQFKWGLEERRWHLTSKDLKQKWELATWMSGERHARQNECPAHRTSNRNLCRVRKS